MPVRLNGSTSGYVELAAPAVAGNVSLTLPNTAGNVVVNGANSAIVSGTAQASTSGTSIDFTGIPSWVKRVTVMFKGVSTSGTNNYLIQIGSGSITSSGYDSAASYISGAALSSTSNGTGFVITASITSSSTVNGAVQIVLLTANTYVSTGVAHTTSQTLHSAGTVVLSGALDRVRVTSVGSTDTFDAGSINILYE